MTNIYDTDNEIGLLANALLECALDLKAFSPDDWLKLEQVGLVFGGTFIGWMKQLSGRYVNLPGNAKYHFLPDPLYIYLMNSLDTLLKREEGGILMPKAKRDTLSVLVKEPTQDIHGNWYPLGGDGLAHPEVFGVLAELRCFGDDVERYRKFLRDKLLPLLGSHTDSGNKFRPFHMEGMGQRLLELNDEEGRPHKHVLVPQSKFVFTYVMCFCQFGPQIMRDLSASTPITKAFGEHTAPNAASTKFATAFLRQLKIKMEGPDVSCKLPNPSATNFLMHFWKDTVCPTRAFIPMMATANPAAQATATTQTGPGIPMAAPVATSSNIPKTPAATMKIPATTMQTPAATMQTPAATAKTPAPGMKTPANRRGDDVVSTVSTLLKDMAIDAQAMHTGQAAYHATTHSGQASYHAGHAAYLKNAERTLATRNTALDFLIDFNRQQPGYGTPEEEEKTEVGKDKDDKQDPKKLDVSFATVDANVTQSSFLNTTQASQADTSQNYGGGAGDAGTSFTFDPGANFGGDANSSFHAPPATGGFGVGIGNTGTTAAPAFAATAGGGFGNGGVHPDSGGDYSATTTGFGIAATAGGGGHSGSAAGGVQSSGQATSDPFFSPRKTRSGTVLAPPSDDNDPDL